MTVTAQDIITRALRKIGAIDAVETPSAEEAEDALGSLNDILGSWSVTRGLVIAQAADVLSLIAGQAMYTLGPGGSLDAERPIRIESAFLRESGVDTPVAISPVEYADVISRKDQSGSPETAYVRYASPQVELTLFPVPGAAAQLHMKTWRPVEEIADPYLALDMPRYLATYLRLCLQIDLAPDYGRAIDQSWEYQRQELRQQISAVHGRRQTAVFDPALLPRRMNTGFRDC